MRFFSFENIMDSLFLITSLVALVGFTYLCFV